MARGRGQQWDRSRVAAPVTRRRFMQAGAGAGAGLMVWRFVGGRAWAMPRSGTLRGKKGTGVDYYRIGCQFEQAILPAAMGFGATKVWSYGSVDHPETFNYPAFTIEAWCKPARVEWINELIKPDGSFGRTCFRLTGRSTGPTRPVGSTDADEHGTDHDPYREPVPLVTHLHGGHNDQQSDGYARGLVSAKGAPHSAPLRQGGLQVPGVPGARPGRARAGVAARERRVPVRQRPARDDDVVPRPHARDARLNVYAGPAGLYLLRGEPQDAVGGKLPGPAPARGDPPGRAYFEIPIAIQDRSFTEEGELCYPDNRANFEELDPSQLQIPVWGDPACGGPSDVPPIWNPEFFGNAMVVNWRTWPKLEVQRRRYHSRHLNGCKSRFLILRLEKRAGVLADRQRGRLPAEAGRTHLGTLKPDGSGTSAG